MLSTAATWHPLIVNLAAALGATLLVLFVVRQMLRKRGRGVPRRFLFGLPLLAVLGGLAVSALKPVEVGTVQVMTIFGQVQERPYHAGLNIVSPFARGVPMAIRRQIFHLSGGTVELAQRAGQGDGPITVALTKDGTPIASDVSFPYFLDADQAWKVFQLIGPDYEAKLLHPAARTALRDAIATFTWQDAVSTEREKLARLIHENFSRIVQENLVAVGFAGAEAERAIMLLPVQIRHLSPPQRILHAVSERMAAEVDLQRQSVLTKIAAEEALRRGNEGLGVQNLFAQLPADFTAEQIQSVLYALADKQRADALTRAVESDQVRLVVMSGGGGGGGSAAVPAVSLPPVDLAPPAAAVPAPVPVAPPAPAGETVAPPAAPAAPSQ